MKMSGTTTAQGFPNQQCSVTMPHLRGPPQLSGNSALQDAAALYSVDLLGKGAHDDFAATVGNIESELGGLPKHVTVQ